HTTSGRTGTFELPSANCECANCEQIGLTRYLVDFSPKSQVVVSCGKSFTTTYQKQFWGRLVSADTVLTCYHQSILC
ncbi:hypothetical protein J8A80_00005, partial [Vibrio parahaemolyticus]|nr:hypothetical protein [Vibrio parahaemolyticus]